MSEIRVDKALILGVLNSHKIPTEFLGNESLSAERVTPFLESRKNTLTFLRPQLLLTSENLKHAAGIVFLDSLSHDLRSQVTKRRDILLVICEFPEAMFYETIRRGLVKMHDENTMCSKEHHVSSREYSIGAFTSISSDVRVGIGTRFGGNCTIERASFGEECVIQSGVRIGEDALGAVLGPAGMWFDRPHLRRVVIGDKVRIENNSVIQAGFLRDTKVGSNCRIGPLTCLGNGVEIGEGTLIAQGVVIAGSASIGANCRIWGNASIREGVRIGDSSIVGMGSVVTRDIPPGETWIGNPARSRRA